MYSVCKNSVVMLLFCWGAGGKTGFKNSPPSKVGNDRKRLRIFDEIEQYTIAHLVLWVAFIMSCIPGGNFDSMELYHCLSMCFCFATGGCYHDLHSYRGILAVWSCAVMIHWETTQGSSSPSRSCNPTSRATWPTSAGRLRP